MIDWTEKNPIVRERWEDGVPVSAIATELGVSIGAVTKRRIKLKLPQRGMGVRTDLGQKARPESKMLGFFQHRPLVPAAAVRVTREYTGGSGAPDAIRALSSGQCKWPIGEPEDRAFRFCKADTGDHATYCAEHRALAYLPPPVRHHRKNWRAA